MDESDFIVTLPSNSNMRTNPTNQPNNYTVKLAEPLNLDGSWEVALVSMQYTPSWYTFKELTIHMFYLKRPGPISLVSFDLTVLLGKHGVTMDSVMTSLPKEFNYARTTFLPAYYDTVKALGEAFSKVMNEALNGVQVQYEYDYTQKGSRLEVSGGFLHLIFENHSSVAELLGLTHEHIPCRSCPDAKSTHYYLVSTRKKAFGAPTAKLHLVSSLWVYSDIINYQLVGDAKAPLLGIVPAPHDGSRRTHYTVNPVHFLGVSRNHISEISVKIVDDKGIPIPFTTLTDENLVCCLRFRRRKSNRSI